MALVLKNPDGTYASKCALCGEILSQPIFATTRFITNKSHDFYRFSDAAMHWNCYVKWPDQSRFASMYFEAAPQRSGLTRSQHRKTLLKNPDVLVEYWFAMNEVSVMLRKSGTDIRLHRSRWQDWLDGAWQSECRPGLEHDAVSECIHQLRQLELPEPAA
jgi:hypothetical protein